MTMDGNVNSENGVALRIECTGARNLPLESLHVIQGDLKDLAKEDYEKFRAELLDDGFSEPIGVWWDGDRWCILSGTQRYRTLCQMRSEGILIPELPVSVIEATDLKAAKKKILALASQYGEVTQEGLYSFVTESGLDPMEAIRNIRLPEINTKTWFEGYFESKSSDDSKSELVTCPSCGKNMNG